MQWRRWKPMHTLTPFLQSPRPFASQSTHSQQTKQRAGAKGGRSSGNDKTTFHDSRLGLTFATFITCRQGRTLIQLNCLNVKSAYSVYSKWNLHCKRAILVSSRM